jgi:hypothetical protein
MNTTIALYIITASFDRDGQVQDCSQAEVLGEAFGVTYVTSEAAESALAECAESVEAYDLDPTTRYSIEQTSVTISDVTTEPEDGAITVSAHVEAPGYSGITCWSAKPRHTAAGIDGLEPAGDSIDAWTDGDLARILDADTLIHVGTEILALAARA